MSTQTSLSARRRPCHQRRERGLFEAAAVLASALLLTLCQPLVDVDAQPLLPGICGALVLLAWTPLLVLERVSATRLFVLVGLASLIRYALMLQWLHGALLMAEVARPTAAVLYALAIAILSMLTALSFLAAHSISKHTGLPRWLSLPLCFTAIEVLQNGAPFGGFPWGSLGYAFASVPVLLQGASLFGVYGLGCFIVLHNVVLADAWCAWRRRRRPQLVPAATASLLVAVLLVYGGQRLGAAPTSTSTVTFAVLSANVAPAPRQHPGRFFARVVESYRSLQAEAVHQGAEIVVWPELALPGLLPSDARDFHDHWASVGLQPPPAAIIGASVAAGPDAFFNAAVITGPGGQIQGRHDKSHLVPFVETMPWPLTEMLPPLFAPATTAGTSTSALKVPLSQERSVRVGVVICFETAFPEISRALVDDGAEMLVELSNDIWFGSGAGRHQHLAQAVLRSVETGRPVVRAANAGLSTVVDARGGVLLAASTKGALVVPVPRALATTVYVAFGHYFGELCLALALAFGLFALVRHRSLDT